MPRAERTFHEGVVGIDTRQPEFDQTFFEALLGEDELGVVIRAHIQFEGALCTFIDACVPSPKHLRNMRYAHRVAIACALGLNNDHESALRQFGALRNTFAHKPEKKLTQVDVNKLYGSLSPSAREAATAAYANARTRLSGV